MSSGVLNSMGLGGIDAGIIILILLLLVLIVLVLLIVTMVKLSGLKKRYEQFMMGSNARSMEEEIRNLFYDIDYLKKESDENSREIKHIYRRLESVYQKVGLVKYDAFSQMGGKLSFALALLDENNNGFLMNSVHSSDGSYCYIKEITQGSSAIELSGDEQNALNQALSQSYSSRSRRKTDSKKAPAKARPSKEDPELLEAEKVIASLSKSDGGYRVVEEDDGGEGVLSYTTGRRRKRREEDDQEVRNNP